MRRAWKKWKRCFQGGRSGHCFDEHIAAASEALHYSGGTLLPGRDRVCDQYESHVRDFDHRIIAHPRLTSFYNRFPIDKHWPLANVANEEFSRPRALVHRTLQKCLLARYASRRSFQCQVHVHLKKVSLMLVAWCRVTILPQVRPDYQHRYSSIKSHQYSIYETCLRMELAVVDGWYLS